MAARKSSISKRSAILRCLIEGNSIASTHRITGAAKNTILSFQVELGKAAHKFSQGVMVNLPCRLLQVDEMYSVVGCKRDSMHFSMGHGPAWLWRAICAETKLIPGWHIGNRSLSSARSFFAELKERFSGVVQITSDRLRSYPRAISENFNEVDFIQEGTGKILGNPDMNHANTNLIERANLTMRQSNSRFARGTSAYSKIMVNHLHSIAISMLHYNFCRPHQTLKGRTPAQAAGIAEGKWSLEQMVALVDDAREQAMEAEFEAKFSEMEANRKEHAAPVLSLLPEPNRAPNFKILKAAS
jgi:IS1 family transposase